MKINVTAKDIKEGSRGKVSLCPVARAIQRRLNPIWTAAVTGNLEGGACVRIFRFGCNRRVNLPHAVSKFVIKFYTQGRRWVKPFTFGMEIPAEARKD